MVILLATFNSKHRDSGTTLTAAKALALNDVPTNRQDGNLLLGPLVLATDLILLLGGEVILDVESLADLLGRLALDHVGDGLAANVQEGLDVEVVGSLPMLAYEQSRQDGQYTYQDDLEQHLLINLHELLVPLVDIGGLATGIIVVMGARRVVLMVVAPLNNLVQDRRIDLFESCQSFLFALKETQATNVGNRNSLARVPKVFEHVLDQNRPLSNIPIWTGIQSQHRCSGWPLNQMNVPTKISTASELVRVILFSAPLDIFRAVFPVSNVVRPLAYDEEHQPGRTRCERGMEAGAITNRRRSQNLGIEKLGMYGISVSIRGCT
jgi:hypothetical protein